jgi:ABC-type branched-subunit amino acid transport system ATPase component
MSGGSQQALASGATTPLLEVRDLSVTFGGLTALHHVSISIAPGEVVGLVGPNGSGKTTLLNVISGIYAPSAGRILWNGHEIRGFRPWHAFALGISRTFQGVELVPNATVLENVLLARHAHGCATWVETCFWLGRAARDERRQAQAATKILARLGVSDLAYTRVGSLPLGVQKVVAVARALAASPRLILLDEPTAGLSWPDKVRLADVVSSIVLELGLSAIWVEHDLEVIKRSCSRVAVLHEGQKLADGPVSQVLSDPRVLALYSGFRAPPSSA